MDFFGISPFEILLIMVVALMVLGPERLPAVARTAGRYVNQFRQLSQEVRTQVARELTLEVTDEQGNKVGLDKYIVQMREEVTGTFQDVKNSLANETAMVKSALNVTGNVVSDTITTQVITNPDSPLEAMSQTRMEAALPIPANSLRPTHIHILQVSRPEAGNNAANLTFDSGIVKEGTTWSEYASSQANNANKIDYSAYSTNNLDSGSEELNEFEIQLLDDSGQVLSRDVIKLKAGTAGKLTINIAPAAPKKFETLSDIDTNQNLNGFAGSSSHD